MEENFKSKLGFIFFVFIILTLGIGGYFFTRYTLNNNNESQGEVNTITSNKIDEGKDYIYFINDKVISEDAGLNYRDVVINLKNQETLTAALQKENELYKNTVKYISDEQVISSELITYNYDNLYALTNRTYENYEYDKYVSLVIKDYNYSCFDLLTFQKTKSYVFDIKTGEIVSEEELLNKYNMTIDIIKEKIRGELLKSQTTEDGVELIKIDETLNDFNNYSLYINDLGKLCITYLVKSSEVDYNLNMEVS